MTKKYSDSLKLKVVKEYQEGYLGIRPLAKKYGIKSKSQVDRWIKLYEKFGDEGLKAKKHIETYSVQFKLDVLRFIERTGSSEMEAALHFGMKVPTRIASWKKAYREGGVGGLSKKKGWPSMSDASKRNKNKKFNEKEMTYEQKLERENELLRLELEYLKKLRAFQIDPEGYLEKHKQRYHSNSKKNSN
ncbi:helix-turn-helix domain-containing protein [Oceanobacillus sp. Castelsardo]|uniref:helix-turn-helix domain-containing protein n=1 Tax=Oceanobacillus sp. Castelsardo TaxID=1851204 RepID=UPI0008398D29|nr:helix-turn-helix domain-containing protein [Oceanobacillus sp. Castelsardo]